MAKHRPFTHEDAVKYQPLSVEARLKNTTIAEATKDILDEPVTNKKHLEMIEKAGLPVTDEPTYRDFVISAVIMRTVQKGRMRDLLDLKAVIGESDENIDIEDSDAYFEAAEMEGKG